MTSPSTTRESERFTIMHQAIVREQATRIEDFRDALDRMTVAGVISAPPNEERMQASPAGTGVKVLEVGNITYQAYAYLSPQGKLQIWMEAVLPEPEPAVLAIARFSWNFADETPEAADEHQTHAKRVTELQRRDGRVE